MPLEAEKVAALAELDTVLAAKPEPDHAAFSAAVHHLCALRDELAVRARDAGASRGNLDHVNAVISIVLAGHFPLGGIPWSDVEKARGWLAAVATA